MRVRIHTHTHNKYLHKDKKYIGDNNTVFICMGCCYVDARKDGAAAARFGECGWILYMFSTWDAPQRNQTNQKHNIAFINVCLNLKLCEGATRACSIPMQRFLTHISPRHAGGGQQLMGRNYMLYENRIFFYAGSNNINLVENNEVYVMVYFKCNLSARSIRTCLKVYDVWMFV